MACAAATAAIAAGGLIVLSRRVSQALLLGSFNFPDWAIVESRVPAAVVAAWTALALSGRWRPEASWLDRAGCVCGGVWVVLWIFRWYFLLHI